MYLRRPISVIVVACLTGCATTGSMKSAPLSEGIPQTYTADFDSTLKAAREAVVEAGLQIEEVNKIDETNWTILGKKPTSAWSWGELVRVSVEQSSETTTTVRVLTKRRLATNVTAKGDYSKAILSNIELKLSKRRNS